MDLNVFYLLIYKVLTNDKLKCILMNQYFSFCGEEIYN